MLLRRVGIVVLVLATHASSAATPVAAQNPWPIAATAPAGFDRGRAQQDARLHLERLIAIDTQNPPGNELAAATYVESVLKGLPGVETRVVPIAEGRANLVARLRATKPTRRAVLVMGHMDTVGADPAKWTTPPLKPTEREGYLYGRGAIDDKGMLAATIAAIVQLAPQRDALTRDLVFLGTADEETGGNGIARLLEQDFALIKDVEFALNEGGRIRLAGGRVESINVQVTEKLPYTVRAVARGTSGHGSVPLPDNALAALARALTRVHEWKAPLRLNVVTREYFRRLATIEPDAGVRRAMETLASAMPGTGDPAAVTAADLLLSRTPLHNAVLRTGVSLTMLNAGIRSNVIPSEATATLNVRVLPDEDINQVIAELNRIGAEPAVTFALDGKPEAAPPISPIDSAMFRAMEEAGRAMAPAAVAIPFMSTGATDGALLRERGIPTYGILPMPMTAEDELRMHGDNERVPISALGWAAEYVYRVLRLVN